MFQYKKRQTTFSAALSLSELVYHSVVRSIRKTHGNAVVSLLMNMIQAVVFVMAFFLMFTLLGLRGSALRGDFLLYIMSGIFLFMVHTKTLGAVVGSDGPSSPMMKHAPMNTVVSISAAAVGALYIQILSMVAILFVYHVSFKPIVIEDPIGALGMLMLAWFTGIGVGVIFLALKPWFPTFVKIAVTVYQRANMIASGKMFVANTLPAFMLSMFDWNPLFHCIDQTRGFMFLNYVPRNSDPWYPLLVGLVLFMLGFMGEFYTRRNVSLSWSAKR